MPDVFVAKKSKGKDEVKVVAPKEVPRGKKRHKIGGHTHNPISAFNYYPDHVNFVAADKEEKIVLLLRRHPITNVRWVLMAIVMMLAPFFLSFLPVLESVPESYQLIIVMSWYLITTAFVIEEFLAWYFNVNVITDERVFDVDFVNLVYREITDANIDQIQDVTVSVGGALRTMFNYGNVVIQTASEIPQIEFVAVPKPDTVAQILRKLRVEEEVEKLEGRVR